MGSLIGCQWTLIYLLNLILLTLSMGHRVENTLVTMHNAVTSVWHGLIIDEAGTLW